MKYKLRIGYNENESIFKSDVSKDNFVKISSNLYFVFGIIVYTLYIINTFRAYVRVNGNVFISSMNLFVNFALLILTFVIFHFTYFIKSNNELMITKTTLFITIITFLPSVDLLFFSI